jgi:FtsK/SpoIIIE family
MSETTPNNEEETQEVETTIESPTPEQRTLGGAGLTLAVMSIMDVVGHLGLTGLVVSGLASYVVWRHGPEVYSLLGREIGLSEMSARFKRKNADAPNPKQRTMWQKAWNIHPQEPTEAEGDKRDKETMEEHALSAGIFAEDAAEDDGQTMARITVEEAIKHTERNSYHVYVGRSLTDENGRAMKMGFRSKHLKFIGASQRGKSSEIAALLTIITATHDPGHVQVAILDLEDKTGRLFADLPHIKRLRINGKEVRLHATNVDQVLEYLIYITKFMEFRYQMAPAVLVQQPIFIVYIEEFLRLRRMLKARIATSTPGPKREKAQRDYAALIDCIDALAARGLKAHIQLWLCAQVDYVDEDLREALANVMEGMSFCVRPSAAAAAGFTRSDLIAKSRHTNRVGQCVVETTDLTDLVQAIEFDLAARLLELEAAYPQAPLYQSPAFEVDTEHLQEEPSDNEEGLSLLPPLPLRSKKVSLEDAYTAWQNGAKSIRKIERAFSIPYNQARDLVIEMERRGMIPPQTQAATGE